MICYESAFVKVLAVFSAIITNATPIFKSFIQRKFLICSFLHVIYYDMFIFNKGMKKRLYQNFRFNTAVILNL